MNKKILTSFLAISLFATNIFCFNNIKSNAVSNSELFEETLVKKIGGNEDDYAVKIIKEGTNYIALIDFQSSEIEGITNNGLSDALIVKLDSNLNILSKKSFGSTGIDEFYNIISVKDGYIVVGSSSSSNIVDINDSSTKDTTYGDAWILKMDKEFNIIKQSTIGGTQLDNFTSIKEVNDGYIVAGKTSSLSINGTNSNGSRDILLVKYDFNLDIVNKTFIGGTKNEYSLSDFTNTNNGLMFTFSTMSTNVLDMTTNNTINNEDTVIVEIDKDLNVINKKIFGGNKNETIEAICRIDNGYALIGYTTSTNIAGINNINENTEFIAKLNNNFELINAKEITLANEFTATLLTKTSTGYTAFGYGMNDSYNEIGQYILKLDNEFNLINEKFYKDDIAMFYSTLANDTEHISIGMTPDLGFDGLIKKIRLLYKNEQSIDLQVVADNSLEMSLSTNQISFKGYNGVVDLTNNDLNITVTSGLYYDLFATLNDELRGSNDTQATINKTNLGIKTLEDIDYKNFINVGTPLKLVENHVNGRNMNHNINLKLKGDSSVKADTYSTTITFEAIQK